MEAGADSYCRSCGARREPGVHCGACGARYDAPADAEATFTFAGEELPLSKAKTTLERSASWFYWIAGLSLVNTGAALFEQDFGMMIGLGITQLADGVLLAALPELGPVGAAVLRALHLVFVVGAAGFFVFIGVHARRGAPWAFTVGLVCYALDGLVFFFVSDWFGLGFHVFVLVMVFPGRSLAKAIAESKRAHDAAVVLVLLFLGACT